MISDVISSPGATPTNMSLTIEVELGDTVYDTVALAPPSFARRKAIRDVADIREALTLRS